MQDACVLRVSPTFNCTKCKGSPSRAFACSRKIMLSLGVHPQDYVLVDRMIDSTAKANPVVGNSDGTAGVT